MDYQDIFTKEGNLVLSGIRNTCLEDILSCGQCFRWNATGPSSFEGIAFGRLCRVSQQEDQLVFDNMTPDEFHRVWHTYFDFDRDYSQVKAVLQKDPVMAKALAFTPGMRVLRQEPWETVCSFIISANNNIPRIKGIIQRLCGLFGQPVQGGFAFPTAQRMSSLNLEDLSPIRCGYRARYLLDAARLVAEGALDLDAVATLPLDQAAAQLRQICGVGEKVAACILLYGFGRGECVPVDVWIRRALEQLYPSGMPEEILPVAGLGQQYLFHYVRNCPDALPSV